MSDGINRLIKKVAVKPKYNRLQKIPLVNNQIQKIKFANRPTGVFFTLAY